MNYKTRLQHAIQTKSIDRPPVICPGGMMNPVVRALINEYGFHWEAIHTDALSMATCAKAVVDAGLFENYGVPFCLTVEAQALGATVTFGEAEPLVSKYPIKTLSDFPKLSPIDLNQGRIKVVLDAITLLKNEEIPVIGNLPGPISLATNLIEPSTFYKALKKEPETVHKFLTFLSEQLIVFGSAQINAGADVITISDPSGTNEILGPMNFSNFMMPYLSKMIDALKDKGATVIIHICGQMKNALEIIKDLRADCFSFDSCVSLKDAKEIIQKPIMGNISTYAIEYSCPDKIKMLVSSQKSADIISPACGLGLDSPLDNIRAIKEQLNHENHS